MTSLLGTLDGVEVVGGAESAARALEVVTAETDIVLMDIELGDGSGIEVTAQLRARFPALAVLMVTMHDADAALVAAVRAGARGYLVKGATPEEVERTVRAVAAGGVVLGSAVGDRALGLLASAGTSRARAFPQLTDREHEILDLVAAGWDNAAIARRLVLSQKTVRNYVSSVLTKLDAPSRSAAVVRARDAGLGVHDGAR
ncbi:DNA-binding response regulator [Rhodococcus rhodnii]|nr:DNA-binding response regulator [Rhodococcus rhodnii]